MAARSKGPAQLSAACTAVPPVPRRCGGGYSSGTALVESYIRIVLDKHLFPAKLLLS
jgi:hypothetical protein